MRYNLFSIILEKKLSQIFHKTLLRTSYGKLSVTYPNKEIYYYGTDDNNKCDINLNNSNFFLDIILKGNIGFAESYINKNFSTNKI